MTPAIPFYNQPDKSSCFQACLKMILGTFLPEKDFTWQELYEFSDKKPDKWTWPMKALINMKSLGLEVVDIEKFDYHSFIKNPQQYLIDAFGQEVAQAQMLNSDIPAEVENSKLFLEKVQFENRLPTLVDLANLLDQGYVLGINLNSRILENRDGYAGHFVILKAINSSEVIINDPWGETGENNHYPIETFVRSWAYPDENAQNLIAVRK
jgi:hypothetical protein